MTQWSDEEADKLIKLVLMWKRKPGGIVNWDAVMKSMPGRTKQQCQTYINNYQRRQKEPKYDLQRRNYRWSPKDEFQLLQLAAEFQNNWEFIHRNYFQKLSARRLKNKYCQLVKLNAEKKSSPLDEIIRYFAVQ